MRIEFESCSQNEAFARTVVAAYITRLNPTLEELSDVKTAVSEAVTNAVIHGYESGPGRIFMTCNIHNNEVEIYSVVSGRRNGRGVQLTIRVCFANEGDEERLFAMQEKIDAIESVEY